MGGLNAFENRKGLPSRGFPGKPAGLLKAFLDEALGQVRVG
jgi:hypothetical protein